MKRAKKSGTAQAVGRSGRTGCWPLPSEWDKFIPPQAVNISVERIREEIGGGTLTRPVWNQEWLRGLEAFIRSIAQDEIRKANPAGQPRTASVRSVAPGCSTLNSGGSNANL